MFKLSPSDFAYLYHDCKHCFYLKNKEGIRLPSIPFPGAFSKLNSLLEADLVGMNLKEITPQAPEGIIRSTEGFLRSAPIPNKNACYISGRYDALAEMADHTFTVIDFKITEGTAEKADKYASQLWAYQYALEYPENRKPVTVGGLAILAISPATVAYTAEGIKIGAKPSWFPVNSKMDEFYQMVDEISNLLVGPEPPPSPTCTYCTYRENYHQHQQPVQEEFDFIQ